MLDQIEIARDASQYPQGARALWRQGVIVGDMHYTKGTRHGSFHLFLMPSCQDKGAAAMGVPVATKGHAKPATKAPK